ncbi:MAG: hypothetical protein HUJ99_00315 [Bacteroidaceae bacterium]|nr:hypothetical protein [Bacteroidaceae bacterium]
MRFLMMEAALIVFFIYAVCAHPEWFDWMGERIGGRIGRWHDRFMEFEWLRMLFE